MVGSVENRATTLDERFATAALDQALLQTDLALLDALERGHLGGAGLDVFDPEPTSPDNPLLHREDVVVTPHIGGATLASKDRLWHEAISQALQVLRGERPPNLVNPEVWPLDVKS